jgi:hypothetical protein
VQLFVQGGAGSDFGGAARSSKNCRCAWSNMGQCVSGTGDMHFRRKIGLGRPSGRCSFLCKGAQVVTSEVPHEVRRIVDVKGQPWVNVC